MSRTTKLDSMTTKVCIVIRKNKYIPISKIKQYCDVYFINYAFIEHEKDVEPTTGLVEGVHYHIVGNFNNTGGRKRLATRLNDICSFFGFKDCNGIEIEQYNSLVGSIQYLIHKNQPEKSQHKFSEVIHNFEKGEFDLLMTSDTCDVLTFDRLYTEILTANNILDVIKAVGLKLYKDYRFVIRDMWDFIKND